MCGKAKKNQSLVVVVVTQSIKDMEVNLIRVEVIIIHLEDPMEEARDRMNRFLGLGKISGVLQILLVLHLIMTIVNTNLWEVQMRVVIISKLKVKIYSVELLNPKMMNLTRKRRKVIRKNQKRRRREIVLVLQPQKKSHQMKEKNQKVKRLKNQHNRQRKKKLTYLI